MDFFSFYESAVYFVFPLLRLKLLHANLHDCDVAINKFIIVFDKESTLFHSVVTFVTTFQTIYYTSFVRCIICKEKRTDSCQDYRQQNYLSTCERMCHSYHSTETKCDAVSFVLFFIFVFLVGCQSIHLIRHVSR